MPINSTIEKIETINNKKDNIIKKCLKNFVNYIDIFTVLIVSIIYVTQGTMDVIKTGKSIADIVGDMAVSMCVGIVISISLRTRGLISGRNSDNFIASLSLYANAKEEAKPNIDKLNPFCIYKNEQELENAKRELIENNGLNYSFWKKGMYTPEKYEILNLDDLQIKCLQSVDKIKINKINPNILTCDLPSGKNAYKFGRFGRDEKDYKRTGTAMDLFFIIMFSVIFGYYIFIPLMNEEILSSMLWNSFQLSIWLCNGILKLMSAKSFMENEYRQTHIIQKTDLLNEFNSIMAKTPEILNKYDFVYQYENNKEEIINGDREQQLNL